MYTEMDAFMDDEEVVLYYQTTPKRPPPPGWSLMHNHIRHSRSTPIGLDGFRAWIGTEPYDGFVLCPCGWAPEAGPHYAGAEHVAYQQEKLLKKQ